jgi:type IV conjugative transfer system coupling protein TraD
MLNNFIGGGQVFLHKLRMFKQVAGTTVIVSLIAGIILAMSFNSKNGQASAGKVDWDGAITYAKAKLALTVHPALSAISIHKKAANVDAYSNNLLWKKRMLASSVVTSSRFALAWQNALKAIKLVSMQAFAFGASSGLLVFLLWSKFGRGLREDKQQEGTGAVLTAEQVRRKLKNLGKSGDLSIGKMPLVKDMETRHFLVTGSTGSGKTNLIHNLMLQVEKKKQPAIVIDQTGEMIAKYYNKDRGDIIFNPLDSRSHNWDFWTDCGSREELERFSKILMGFNRKQSNSHSDPFWENAAETVFNACAEYLRPKSEAIHALVNMVCHSNLKYLQTILANTEAERYLGEGSKQTASSILSVLASNAKPLTYLTAVDNGRSFSMREHFTNIKDGSEVWLFLATKPSSRGLTLPLMACLTELALASLMEVGINQKRRVWIIMDELASLGKLPALSPIITEGRKYGACVIAGMQSLNQLYEGYGSYGGSTIFGQFGTSFFFRNTEPAIAKMVSSMCGQQTIIRQQKNTSFGANEFRDGVSYTEQQQKKHLVEPEDLASLAVGECYVLLPEPAVRLAKVQTEEAKIKEKNEGFSPVKEPNLLKTETDKIAQEIKQPESSDKEDTGGIMSTAGFQTEFKENEKKKQEELLPNL